MADVPPTVLAALLLVAIPVLDQLGLEHPSASAVINALKVSRSRAYGLRERLAELLGELVKPTGRPPKAGPELAPSQLATTLLSYVYGNPGAVSGSARRRSYTRGFQLFVLNTLVDAHPELEHEAIALSIAVPWPTLKDWLRCERLAPVSDAESRSDAQTSPLTAREAQVSTILEEYKRWNGAFTAFCDHVQRNLHLPFKRTAISTILEAYGVRRPKQRPGRSPDEAALRESFETFFPNAQWVGDGSKLSIVINGERYSNNLELMVDPYSGAFVGANMRPTEDAAAVVAAFEDAREATKATPIAVLLDNKPSNYAPEVIDAVAPAVVMRATPLRPQNKAHIEGGFGLLKPTLGELDITASTPKEFAWALLTLAVIVWGRTINHRPRHDRGGLTRAKLLQDTPTAEEIAHAKERLAEIQRRQERARETRAARQDPVVRAYVAEALIRLCLEDPDGHFLTAIARYPLDAIVEAVSIFGGRQQAKSLPDGADARYLLGIAHNTTQDCETWAIMDALWEERARAKDLVLRHLERQRESIATNAPHPDDLIAAYIDCAVTTLWQSERAFWLRAVATVIKSTPSEDHLLLYRRAARRIQATYSLPNRERQAAIRILAGLLQPLQ